MGDIITVTADNIIAMVRFLRNNWILTTLLLMALFLRTYRLDYVELFGDEIDAGYQAYSLLNTGKDYRGHLMPVYAQSLSEWRAPGLMYAMTPFIKVFGLNEWGVRLGSAIFGVMSIMIFYLLIVEVGFSKKIGLMTSFLLAIVPWNIQYGRAGFEVTLMTLSLMTGAYFLIKAIRLKNNWLIIISGLAFSLSIYTYNTANIYVPLICLITIYCFGISKKQLLILMATGLVFCLPVGWQIVFGHGGDRFETLTIFNNKDVVAEIIGYRNADGNSLASKFFYNKLTVSVKKVLFNYSNALGSSFLFNQGDVTFRHSLHQVGNMFWVELLLIIWGIVITIRSKGLNSGQKWLIGLLLISPVPASLTIDGYNHATRLFLLIYPLLVLAAIGFVNLKNNFKFLILVAIIFEFSFFQYYYWTFYRNESWRWWHTGYREAMTYVSENRNNYESVLIDNTYEPALIRYLFWNQIDPRSVFDLNDKGNFCLDRVCFVNFGDNFKIDKINPKTLYLLSQERNVGGDWDLSKTPPKQIKVLKTIRNYYQTPIFYLVTRE